MLLEASVTKDSANNNSRLKWNKFVVVIVKKRVREAIKREVEKHKKAKQRQRKRDGGERRKRRW